MCAIFGWRMHVKPAEAADKEKARMAQTMRAF
jgi:hypothetical protein